MSGILDGIRVIDWTLWQVGPYATAMLADLGAEVIHLEERGVGDSIRGMTHFFGVPMEAKGIHIPFEEHNRGKKSLAVDLKKPEGRKIVYDLVQKSDVFVTNFRQAAAEKLGLDYVTLNKLNPRLIYAAASGYGRKGPDAAKPALEIVGFARSGAMLGSGEKGMPPIYLTPGIGDRTTSLFLALGVLGALFKRERQGTAQELHVSLLGSLVTLQGYTVMSTLVREGEFPRYQRDRIANPIANFYRCKDNRWIVLGLVQWERHWPAFCDAVGIPEMKEDPRVSDPEKREANSPELIAMLDDIFASEPYEEWDRRFREHSDFIYERVNSIEDLVDDPQVVENRNIIPWDHPVAGPIKFVNFPVEFSETPAAPPSPAPQLGQHTEEILEGVCGYTWDQITELGDKEVI